MDHGDELCRIAYVRPSPTYGTYAEDQSFLDFMENLAKEQMPRLNQSTQQECVPQEETVSPAVKLAMEKRLSKNRVTGNKYESSRSNRSYGTRSQRPAPSSENRKGTSGTGSNSNRHAKADSASFNSGSPSMRKSDDGRQGQESDTYKPAVLRRTGPRRNGDGYADRNDQRKGD
ncbi:hypothetical protein GNI_044830 [Gregarina niphandrodes]|uniref:Uncharacterized protein n=1 Tax=Gregarina niphandrodes TaxID=110365 RepID=A0A023B9W0_GRENI|nr:hypothetical protein GNI_044830 [Gregarina niphandrodes]EZG76510.1 hypothetical protein GNI_044830 [Gregarina niphandrodes]|eukprot:XP_011129570.1 hypothetical protein GNI_044830 [Gregarina niphandrodes]